MTKIQEIFIWKCGFQLFLEQSKELTTMSRQFHKTKNSQGEQFYERLRLDFHLGTNSPLVSPIQQGTALFSGSRRNLNVLKYGNLDAKFQLKKKRKDRIKRQHKTDQIPMTLETVEDHFYIISAVSVLKTSCVYKKKKYP